ncbi:hypothetical protein BGZ83_005418 [Gryganskiella cystojenkinii]|nr:hypothetical protein BGZ83_005418 [Gryganskiella cystojenkinii]
MAGNGESEGQMGYSNWDDDFEDIDTVVNYWEQRGYEIYALIGHSRGAISMLNYAALSNHAPLIPHIVSISTRFDMADVKRRHGKHVMNMMDDEGYFDWVAHAAGKEVSLRVTRQNFDDFINFNTKTVVNIPSMTNILLCHGSEDAVVPVKDVATLQSHLSHANTTVRIITNADHNYRDHIKEISETVAHYFSVEGRKEDWTRRIMPNWKTWVNAVGGVLNFRTVGDTWIPSKNDGTVKYLRPGVIYRCADISSPTEEGIKVLKALNITDVYDLRSTSEVERRGTFQVDKIKRHHIPVFADEDYSPVKIAARFAMYLGGTEGFADAYMSMMPTIKNFFQPVLDHVVKKRTPFIVHCTAGKDRTGVVCALLQLICGVDEETIAWEYELTRRCMAIKEEDVQFLKTFIGDETADSKVREALSAKAEYMTRFLEKFHTKYGTIHEFLMKEMQLTNEQIQEVHDALVVTIPLPRSAL